MDTINRGVEKERNGDRDARERGWLMRRAWRGGAPRTSHALPHFISAFTLSYVPLLDSLFASFLFLSLLRHTYVILTLSTKPHSSSASFPPLRASFRLDRLIFLFQPSLLFRIFTLLHFYAITFRNYAAAPYTFPPSDSAVANDSLEFLLDQSFIHVCRFIRQTGRKAAGYYQDRCCKIFTPASSAVRRHSVRILRTVSSVHYSRLPFNPPDPQLPC